MRELQRAGKPVPAARPSKVAALSSSFQNDSSDIAVLITLTQP